MLTTKSLGRKEGYLADMTMPQIPPAGISTGFAESAKDALTWGGRPETPADIKKWRASTVHEPGKIVRHPGTADDPIREGPFGDKSAAAGGQSVLEAIRAYPESEMGRWKLEQAESVYASNQREPLGKGYVRGHNIPTGLGTERPFGMVYDALGKERARQAATVVFPTDKDPEDDPKATEMYKRSHAAFQPGEQRRRDYDWQKAGIDPAKHRFGATDKDNYHDGVRKALQPALDQTAQQPALVVSKLHEDFKATSNDYLAKPKMLGTGDRPLPPDHTFGMPSLRRGQREPGVGDLLAAAYPEDQQQPDADLGKSLREGFRNVTKPGDNDRRFGIPSIRTDVRLPKLRSVANTQNYGNEPDALSLLRPPRSAELGISDEHFVKLRPRAEVQALVQEAGLALGDDEFDAVFAMAADADGEPVMMPDGATADGSQQQQQQQGQGPAGGRCCLDTFFRARHHVLAQTLEVAPPF